MEMNYAVISKRIEVYTILISDAISVAKQMSWLDVDVVDCATGEVLQIYRHGEIVYSIFF